MTDCLVYWTTEQLAKSLSEKSLPHAGSAQLYRIERGDRAWICGRLNGEPELFTIGYIDVASKVGKRAAQAEMSRRRPGYRVWDATWHILAAEGKETRSARVSLAPLYREFRFNSKTSTKLTLSNGHPNSQQLQTMRELTTDSAKRLRAHWNASALKATKERKQEKPRIDFDQLDRKQLFVGRLEQRAARALLLGGKRTAPCAFCHRQLPASLLVAAHIKPRAYCSDTEKRQINVNIIGLCKLGCDDLFERGYIEVFDGKIVAGAAEPMTTTLAEFVSPLLGQSVRGWNLGRERFFRWRRDNRLNDS